MVSSFLTVGRRWPRAFNDVWDVCESWKNSELYVAFLSQKSLEFKATRWDDGKRDEQRTGRIDMIPFFHAQKETGSP